MSQSCEFDFDCQQPGQLCYLFNEIPWLDQVVIFTTASPGTCLCNTWYGWEGSNCNKVFSPAVIYLIVNLSIQAWIGTTIGVLSWGKIIQIFKTFGRRTKLTVILFTMISVAIACTFHVLSEFFQIGYTRFFPFVSFFFKNAQKKERILFPSSRFGQGTSVGHGCP